MGYKICLPSFPFLSFPFFLFFWRLLKGFAFEYPLFIKDIPLLLRFLRHDFPTTTLTGDDDFDEREEENEVHRFSRRRRRRRLVPLLLLLLLLLHSLSRIGVGIDPKLFS